MLQQVPKDSILEVWYGKQSNVMDLNRKGYKALYASCWYLDHTKRGTDWLKYYKCDPSPYPRGSYSYIFRTKVQRGPVFRCGL